MTVSKPDFDAAFFRTALGRYATGVTVVTAADADGAPIGLTVSSFNSVSLNPPLVLWSLSGGSSSREAFERCDRYVVNVLSAHQIALARRFATGRTPDRFNGLTVARAPGGTPMLDGGCAAWFECHNRSRYVEGDHVIMVGEVERCGHSGEPPLVFHAGGFDLTPPAPTPPGKRHDDPPLSRTGIVRRRSPPMSADIDCVVIGAGVVGLAIARALSCADARCWWQKPPRPSAPAPARATPKSYTPASITRPAA